jgi:hypothetical protein
MAVVKVDIRKQEGLAGGLSLGQAGPYKVMDLTFFHAIDPALPQNRAITDIDLAPRNARGLVEFQNDVRVIRPVDVTRGNGRLLVDVVNRGNSVALRMMNMARQSEDSAAIPDLGDGFLMRQGYIVAQIGWQYDVPPGKGQRAELPEASTDGKRLTGKVTVTFNPNAAAGIQRLFDRGTHKPHLLRDLNEPGATLTEQDYENGPVRIVPRSHWSFAALKDGAPVPDNGSIYLSTGFHAGKTYQVTYPPEGAPVIGLGLVAMRDTVSFLRHAQARHGNPCGGGIRYVHAFGVSQTGRWLRTFLYYGQNLDAEGRMVFDGVLAHVGGGRRGEFNRRFGLQSDQSKRTLSHLFPFTDVPQTDPATGRTEGLLDRQRQVGGVPKIFFTNGAAEYWGSLGSSVHTNIEMTRDVTPSPEVRIYQFAGTQHGSGSLPLTNAYGGGARLQQPANTVDYRPLLRAALVNLDRWVADGTEPPASKHPRIADGTLVEPPKIAGAFTRIPGVRFPEHLSKVSPAEYGPGLDEARVRNLTGEPLKVGVGYVSMVANVDPDGNEVGGIRLPDLSVPLATHTGWNMRGPEMGMPNLMIGLTGASIPFPVTRAQRQATGDPRPSIEERYASKEDYLKRVQKAAENLVTEGFLLAEDVELVVKGAALRYDVFTTQATPQLAAGRA